MATARFLVSGKVQGVFYRASTREQALALGLAGHANLPDGRVEVLASGAPGALDALERWLQQGPPMARVEAVAREALPAQVLTGFALGIWVYQQTGSVTRFGLISLCTTLPGILFSPVAGALADRWDRRWTMILSDSGSALATLSIALLLYFHRLEFWHIYIAMACSSTCLS